jgi:hypothetical protein
VPVKDVLKALLTWAVRRKLWDLNGVKLDFFSFRESLNENDPCLVQ